MRLTSIKVTDIGGLDHVEVSDLSDVVVFAGPNGVGKTRLIHALIQFFRNPTSGSNIEIGVESTSDLELGVWRAPAFIRGARQTLTSFGQFYSDPNAEIDIDPPC